MITKLALFALPLAVAATATVVLLPAKKSETVDRTVAVEATLASNPASVAEAADVDGLAFGPAGADPELVILVDDGATTSSPEPTGRVEESPEARSFAPEPAVVESEALAIDDIIEATEPVKVASRSTIRSVRLDPDRDSAHGGRQGVGLVGTRIGRGPDGPSLGIGVGDDGVCRPTGSVRYVNSRDPRQITSLRLPRY